MKFIISLLPVILLTSYIHKKDKNKEPSKLLAKLFFAGILSCFLTLFITYTLRIFFPILQKDLKSLNLIGLAFRVFIGIGLVEEFSKWIMIYKLSYNNEEFDEIYDMIIYSTFVSLGFACFENILYVDSGGIATGIVRAILSVPAHAWFGVFIGYYLGLAKLSTINQRNDLKTKYLILSLAIPTILHGIFDYCLLSQRIIFIIIYFIFVILLYIYANKRLNRFANITTKLKYKNNYCPNCGRKVDSNYCPNCGYKND